MIGQSKEANRLLKAVYWAFIVVAGVGVFLTGSRAGVLSLAAAVLVILMTSARAGWKPTAMFLLCLGAGGYLVLHFVPEALLNRVQQGAEAHTFQVRVEYWTTAVTAWIGNPLLGCGAGSSSGIVGNVVHNTFLAVLLEHGLVGLCSTLPPLAC